MQKKTFVPLPVRSRALHAAHTTETLYATAYKALGDGDTQCAQRTFLLMAGVAPFDARAWVGLGASLEQQGKWRRALGVYTLGRSVAPTSIFCKLGEARVLAKLGQHTQAQCVLDAAAAQANHCQELQLIDHMRGEI